MRTITPIYKAVELIKSDGLATRLEAPLLWRRGPSGYPTYGGHEIENIIENLNRIIDALKTFQPDWTMQHFELTAHLRNQLKDKFVLIDVLDEN